MNHFRLDIAKYERHLALFRAHAAQAGEVLASIGSLARATRAIREATAAGRVPVDVAESLECMLTLIARQWCPDAIHEPEPPIDIDEQLLDELIDHLHQGFELMRFRNFVIPPGCDP